MVMLKKIDLSAPEVCCFNCTHLIFKIWFVKAFNGEPSCGYCEVDNTPVSGRCKCEDFIKGRNKIYAKEDGGKAVIGDEDTDL